MPEAAGSASSSNRFATGRGLFGQTGRVLLAERCRTFPAGTQHAALVCAWTSKKANRSVPGRFRRRAVVAKAARDRVAMVLIQLLLPTTGVTRADGASPLTQTRRE